MNQLSSRNPAVGAICRQLLAALGIEVGSYVISIGDVTQPEGDGGLGATAFVFPVTLSNPSDLTTTVSWSTAAGTAMSRCR